MSVPTADQQIKFLTNLQRLLAEGQFVATYKYALLLSLADIAIETGDDSGETLTVSTKLIAEKFIQYYWRQVVPYVPKADPTAGQVLRQNTGKQAAIIRAEVHGRIERPVPPCARAAPGFPAGRAIFVSHDVAQTDFLVLGVA